MRVFLSVCSSLFRMTMHVAVVLQECIGTQSGPRPVSRATTGRSYRRNVRGEKGREPEEEGGCQQAQDTP